MYLGLRWFVQREPLRSRVGPILLLALMAVYCGMFLQHVRYAALLTGAVVLWLCGAVVLLMWRQREERFRIPAVITSVLMLLSTSLVVYRAVLAVEVYQRADWRMPAGDPRWDNSMMLIIMSAHCMLLMYVWFAAAEMYSAVEATAGIDALTGCMNRRALMKLAAHEVARSERSGMPLTVVEIDLDHFKSVNDTFGHAGGDATLCAIVRLLQDRLRSVDLVARTGGEEFVLLLPDTDAVSGAKVVDGLRQAVQAMRLEFEGRVITSTMSAGVTQGLSKSDSWTAMMNRADRALYAAKGSGRNCVIVDDQALKLPRRAVGTRPNSDAAVEANATTLSDGELRLIRKRLG
jgi:diguanylate cyclase (GGDEF)-like protein